MKVTMLLCDAAQVADGKLFILGGGWSVIGPAPTASAIALKIEVGWNEVDATHHWELFLQDADGGEVSLETPDGPQPIEVRGDFQVGRPPDLPEGSPVDVTLAVNLGPIPLPSSSRFTWRLTIDGETHDVWTASFSTRPPAVETGPSLA
jgi:hypothetical protein